MNNLDLKIKKILKEQSDRYMFFSNLEQMRRQCDLLLDLERDMVDSILDTDTIGHKTTLLKLKIILTKYLIS